MPDNLDSKPCRQCGQPVTPTPRKDRKAFWYPRRCTACIRASRFTPQAKEKMRQVMRRINEAALLSSPLGTRTQTKHGYIKIKIAQPSTWMYEHRYVIEQALGRSLLTSEHVHHLDHDKTNNTLENLVILMNSEHTKAHAINLPSLGKWAKQHDCCKRCGTTERPHFSKGYCNPCYQGVYKEQHPERFSQYYKQQYQRRKTKRAKA